MSVLLWCGSTIENVTLSPTLKDHYAKKKKWSESKYITSNCCHLFKRNATLLQFLHHFKSRTPIFTISCKLGPSTLHDTFHQEVKRKSGKRISMLPNLYFRFLTARLLLWPHPAKRNHRRPFYWYSILPKEQFFKSDPLRNTRQHEILKSKTSYMTMRTF